MIWTKRPTMIDLPVPAALATTLWYERLSEQHGMPDLRFHNFLRDLLKVVEVEPDEEEGRR